MPEQGYWYAETDRGLTILAAVRRFREADDALRRRLVRTMGMNVTDVQALRHVIAAERTERPLTPRDLASLLEISTPSVTTLVDRLAGYGHLERAPHPQDRRKVVLRATAHAHTEVHHHLGAMHAEMARIAGDVPEHCRDAVVTFLDAMSAHLRRTGERAEAVPGEGAGEGDQPSATTATP
ncbi:MarR family winged helix-turn-helix transcriptional regulator [Ruania halotolerans]|uniref:MarR family winged helix-turn-helix transcriptional regulator n=1 Tax=Ruania halotolerans TaxID=2897773 RepID=UPI001E31766D|nr:MarR family transcriptional regulator [Ruania halotolerans]UFU06869.1 MarR family transcriptional regulator [Ruania halotolerans]